MSNKREGWNCLRPQIEQAGGKQHETSIQKLGRGKLPMVTIEIAGYQDEISNPNEFCLLYTYFGLCLCIAVAVGNSFRRKNIYHIHIIHCKVSPLPFFHGQYFLVYFGTLNHFFFFLLLIVIDGNFLIF